MPNDPLVDANSEPNRQAPANDTLRLWTAADLAALLGYKESTIRRMATQEPDKLPPRVQGLSRPRWLRSVCEAWLHERSVYAPPAKEAQPRRPRGRPRRVV